VIKPDAEKADGLVTYASSGAVVPEEPLINQIVKASHLAVKTGLPHEIFKREAEADPAYLLGAGYGYGLPYAGYGYAALAAPVIKPDAEKADGLVTYASSGAVVPEEPLVNQIVKASHLATLTGLPHEIFKREAEADPAYLLGAGYGLGLGYGLPYAGYGYAAAALAAPVIKPDAEKADGMVTYASSGAVVPEEPLVNQIVKASHLAVKTGLPHEIFKREADAATVYANGAVVPDLTPSVAAATFAHLSTKAAVYAAQGYAYAPYLGYGYGYLG